MDLIAHRGFAADGPENALSSLVDAAGRADAVEFDVRLSRDGEPVVVHDRRVDRLTDATGPVADFTVDELTAMHVDGTAATIPTLAAVLDAIEGPIVPDIKTDGAPDRVGALLSDYADPVLVSSFRPAVVTAVPDDLETAVLCGARRHAPQLPDDALTDLGAAVEFATEIDADAVHPHHSQCTEEAVSRARSAGLAVNAWTVRSREVGARLRRLGVDGAIADSPAYVPEA